MEKAMKELGARTLLNTERVFGLQVPVGTPVTLNPRVETSAARVTY